MYHVRTILGQERVVDDVGYSHHLFGRVNAWKKAMTVLADDTTADGVNAENEISIPSASLPPQNIMFLDQVDANAMAMARFRLPTDKETFLKMAQKLETMKIFFKGGFDSFFYGNPSGNGIAPVCRGLLFRWSDRIYQ